MNQFFVWYVILEKKGFGYSLLRVEKSEHPAPPLWHSEQTFQKHIINIRLARVVKVDIHTMRRRELIFCLKIHLLQIHLIKNEYIQKNDLDQAQSHDCLCISSLKTIKSHIIQKRR